MEIANIQGKSKAGWLSIMGVTLLEIMLVLAIAAMIIVMSVRYYQSATSSQQANSALEQIISITSAADTTAQATGKYSGLTTSSMSALLPHPPGMNTAWGGAITITSSGTLVTIILKKAPASVCPLIVNKLKADKHYTITSTCSGAPEDITMTYGIF